MFVTGGSPIVSNSKSHSYYALMYNQSFRPTNNSSAPTSAPISPVSVKQKYRQETAVIDLVSSNIYLTINARKQRVDSNAPTVCVGTDDVTLQVSSASCDLALPHLPANFPKSEHVMPRFTENLVGIGAMCDAGYTVTFSASVVTIYNQHGTTVIHGWRDQNGPRIWRMLLLPDRATVPLPTSSPPPMHTSLQAFSAYDLTRFEDLVRYFHASAGFPVWDTCIKEIQASKFKSFPGLTLQNATKYCSMSKETMKGHMVQKRQNFRYTKRKKKNPTVLRPPKPVSIPTSNKLHIQVQHINKLYTDDRGKFPVHS